MAQNHLGLCQSAPAFCKVAFPALSLQYIVPTPPTTGEYRAPSWHPEGGGHGAHWYRQGCSEDFSWVLPPAWVTSHGHDPGEVTWGTVFLATAVLLLSSGTVQ